MTIVAFLGLGAIGHPMAARLAHANGVRLAVWNRTASKAANFAAEHGARHAPTPADAARGAEVVITCFPVSADVESVLDGDEGLLTMARGSLLVDCTSGDPASARRIAARLGEHGIGFLDAPVSGGVKGAVEGALTIMVGGDAALLDRVRPVLEHCGKKIVHCGPVGAGDALKAVNNALLAIHIWSAGEGLVTLAKAGVRPDVALDVINASSGRSNSSMNLFPERVLTRAFPRTFRLALLDKDIGIAADVAREQKVPAPLMQLAADLFRIAHNALGEEADHVETVKVIEQWAGQEIV
jgi:3-hydroxyisobutyrate dehydrogenase